MRRLVWIVVLSLIFGGGALRPAAALELLMFERAGCPYCLRWNRDVEPAYTASEEGRLAPLRRIDMDRREDPRVALKVPVHYSPTFVLADEGREIGRLIGFIDAATFWGLLSKMISDHRSRPGTTPTPGPTGGRPG